MPVVISSVCPSATDTVKLVVCWCEFAVISCGNGTMLFKICQVASSRRKKEVQSVHSDYVLLNGIEYLVLL